MRKISFLSFSVLFFFAMACNNASSDISEAKKSNPAAEKNLASQRIVTDAFQSVTLVRSTALLPAISLGTQSMEIWA
jgi:hypothetical protein